MNLSKRLTFSIFSILLVAALVVVPTAMAAKDGPKVQSIVLDASQTEGDADGPDNDAATAADNVPKKDTVSNGNALLVHQIVIDTTANTADNTTGLSGPRGDLVDVGATPPVDGTFRLMVTFDEDVYNANTAKPDDPNDPEEAMRDKSDTRAIAADDLATSDFTIISALGILNRVDVSANVSITGVTRVQTAGMDTADDATDDKWDPRKFYVTIQVGNAAYTNLPINIALAVNADVIFGIGTNIQTSPFKAAQDGLGNEGYAVADPSSQPYTQYDFQVIARAISAVAVTRTPTGTITSHDTLKLTLTFTPALNPSDIPMRDNLKVTGGEILADDVDTTEVDEGITNDSPEDTPNSRFVVTIIPAGGGGVDPVDITVKNGPGTAFNLDLTIPVDNTPPPPPDDDDDEPVDPGAPTITLEDPPTGGGVFTVTLTYTAAPPTPPTAAGVTVTVTPASSGISATKGTITAASTTRYTIDITTGNVPAGTTVTVTVSYTGSTSKTATIRGAAREYPDAPAVLTPTATTELTARDYLVVTHDNVATMSATDDTATIADAALPENTLQVPLANMPNLADLLVMGGTIDVFVANKAASATATAIYPDVIINEVMWGLDDNAVGTGKHEAHQWIELYNHSETLITASDITIRFVRGRSNPPKTDLDHDNDSATPARKHTDRLSNVLKHNLLQTGWSITGLGQGGSSSKTSPVKFISMSRKSSRYGNEDGIKPDSWFASTITSHVNHLGTPGLINTTTSNQPTAERRPGLHANGSFDSATFGKITFWPPKNSVIINEVYNDANNDLDWLELRFLQRTNIRNWTLSYAKSDRTEVEIMRFPNSDRWFNAGDIVLIVNKDPRETNLAVGQDVTLSSANQARGAGAHKYWNPSGGNSGSAHYLDIPDYNGGDYLLILRTRDGYWRLNGSRDKMHDVVGAGTFAYKTLSSQNPADVRREPNSYFAASNGGDNKGYIWETDYWPMNGHARGKGVSSRAPNAFGSNDGNSRLQDDRKFAVGRVWARNGTKHGFGKDGIYDPGHRGGLGYDRSVNGIGTPGYDNGIVRGRSADLASGKVVVSELMLATDGGRYPQWFELHNTSNNTVDLHHDTDGGGSRQGWSIRVENHRSDSWDSRRRDKLHVEVKFRDLGVRFIQPNQTILIVADKVLNSKANHFPDHRVGSIWASGSARGAFKMADRRDIFLNPKGFLLQIVDGSNAVSDAVGNLDGASPTVFNDVGFDDPYSWNWPALTDMVVNNRRTSLIRLYDGGTKGMHDGVPRIATPDRSVEGSMRGAVLPIGMSPIHDGDGLKEDGTVNPEHRAKYARYSGHAWVHAIDTRRSRVQITWYGDDSDYGTPLHITGTPLPVSLSFFRPTLEEGKVVIRWTTESELDNAGFNIYRSDTRNGEFKQVNEQMIQGNGTTGERSTYKWVDTTAKPDAVYFYQIEDVSFAGERTQLATTKLKGLVSAKGKLTTTWGDLKSQD